MSGGSYDYAYSKIESLAEQVRSRGYNSEPHQSAIRLAFADLLDSVAKAAQALEWCDSCDTSWETAEPEIWKVISPSMGISAACLLAERAKQSLEAAIARAKQ